MLQQRPGPLGRDGLSLLRAFVPCPSAAPRPVTSFHALLTLSPLLSRGTHWEVLGGSPSGPERVSPLAGGRTEAEDGGAGFEGQVGRVKVVPGGGWLGYRWGVGGRGKPVLGGQGGAPTAEGSEVKMPVAQTLCDPVDSNPLGSSAHGILQAKVLEGVASPAAD